MRRPVASSALRRALVLCFSTALMLASMPATLLAQQPLGGGAAASSGDPEVTPSRARQSRIRLPGEDAGEDDEEVLKQNDAFISGRTAGDAVLSVKQAGQLRAAANKAAKKLKKGTPVSPPTYTGPWTEISPNPIVQVTRGSYSFYAVTGRVSALAIRPSNGQKILGGAQGGIWTYDETSGTWTSRTDDSPTLSIGALAIAPSDDTIVYAGTGEGNLSGDSYFGAGVLKSTDGGMHWAPVGGSTFQGVSISKIVVDQADPNRLWAAVLRGRAGSRRQTPPDPSTYGIWESQNGGTTWTLRKSATEQTGPTDLVQDPGSPDILYAAFWSDAIYQSTDHGQTWHKFMAGIPADATFGTGGGTRFALGISHPDGESAVLYAGFEWTVGGSNKPSRIWKSIDGGPWDLLPAGPAGNPDNISGYCGGQCFYDNLIGVDPNDSNIVYALGLFNYGTGSGGVFRSTDGGQTWKDLGYDLHPDYHAIAINPADTNQVMVGNDGGVWASGDRGGRNGPTDPLDANDWENLNGTVNPNTAGVTHRTGLAITQFTSIANNPTLPDRVWGGTQDNGTMRKSTVSSTWFDVESGDGGQVLVDPNDYSYVYGNYYGISPYRNTDGGAQFFSNAYITGGLNLSDRSEFYVPEVMNQLNPDQLFLGTYRLYRTDNAKAANASDVHWNTISGDLTSGCTGTAPNGARGCDISAIGVSGGGDGVYVGTLEGWVQFSPDAVSSADPTWKRVGTKIFPNRPVADIAVDRSNDRIAYVAFNGFNLATPSRPGHVFKTTDGGTKWADISSNLPDAPVNSLQLDASYPSTIYAGTDVGPFVTYNGGASWQALGSGFPSVQIWQLNLDPANRNLAAGTHGRGAWTMHDDADVPAFAVSKSDSGKPVGPGSLVDYTITLYNVGNADATGVTISDPIPARTSFWTAGDGGHLSKGTVRWTGLTVPAGESIDVHFSVRITSNLPRKVGEIVDDGLTVTSASGIGTTGSAHSTPIAPSYAVTIEPTAQTDGAAVGASVTYPFFVTNLGANDDTYTVSATSGTFPAVVLDAGCGSPLDSVSVASGATVEVCLKVDVPDGTANAASDVASLAAVSTGDPTVSATASATTIAVAVATLVVDNDGDIPDVLSYYTDALTAAGQAFDVWDLATDPVLPIGYMKAHTNIVWFTGNSYPDPIGLYEADLASFLDGGGRLFLSGQDILDQTAGTTAFVQDYLHVDWDGSEAQNDVATDNVTGVAGNPVTDGLGTIPLDFSILFGAEYSDQITPIAPAQAAFTDDATEPDALSVSDGPYKVVFLAFPFEAYGSADQKTELMTRVFTYFGS